MSRILRLTVVAAFIGAGSALYTMENPPQQTGRPADLRKRDDAQITMYIAPNSLCGYYGGNSDRPMTCGSSYSCVVLERSGARNVGCCDDFINCPNTLPSTYIGYAEGSSSGFCTGRTCTDSDLTRVCGGANFETSQTVPVAHTILDPPGTAWVCEYSKIPPVTVLPTYINQKAVAPSWSTTIFGPSETSSEDTSSNLPTSTSPGGGSVSPTPTNTSDSKSIGIIVGGVVGGVALLTILAVAGFCIFKKRKPSPPAVPYNQPQVQVHSQPMMAANQFQAQDNGGKQWQQPVQYQPVPGQTTDYSSMQMGPGQRMPSMYSEVPPAYPAQGPLMGGGAFHQDQNMTAYEADGSSPIPGVSPVSNQEHHRGTMQELPANNHQ